MMFSDTMKARGSGIIELARLKKEEERRKKDEQFDILANSQLGASAWFLSTLRVFLVTEHLIMKVRHLGKLLAVVLAEISRLPYVLGYMGRPCHPYIQGLPTL